MLWEEVSRRVKKTYLTLIHFRVEVSNQAEKIVIKIEGDYAMKANGQLTEVKDKVLRMKDPPPPLF